MWLYSLVCPTQYSSIFEGNGPSMARVNVSALLPTLCMCLFASGSFIYSTTYYSNVCCTCPNMGDKRNPALILDSTCMQNCPPCYCPSCYHQSGNILLIPSCWTNMWNDNYSWTTEWSAQSEHANASAAEFVSFCYNDVRRVTVSRVTRLSPVLLSSFSVILYIFSIGKIKLYTRNCISK